MGLNLEPNIIVHLCRKLVQIMCNKDAGTKMLKGLVGRKKENTDYLYKTGADVKLQQSHAVKWILNATKTAHCLFL